MTPKFGDFFKSFYYANTYVPPVDLSEEALSKDLLSNEDNETALKAQKLISIPEVQAVLSSPLTYNIDEILDNNDVLIDHGFNLLSYKPYRKGGKHHEVPFYSVTEHDDLQGWIIKSGAVRSPEDKVLNGPSNDLNEMAFFNKDDSILRIEMAKRIKQVAQEANIEVVIPKKKLVTYANANDITDINRKYCILCEKLDVLSPSETIEAIGKLDPERQRDLARNLSTIIQKAGYLDASFHNIRLNNEGKLAFIDTEPAGLMTAKKPGLKNYILNPRGASVEKCARIGLYALLHQSSKVIKENGQKRIVPAPGLEAFHEQIGSDYDRLSNPELSKWKMGLSICSAGLIPAINAVAALAFTKWTKETHASLTSVDDNFKVQSKELSAKPTEEYEQAVADYRAKRTPLAKKYYAYIEGTPFKKVVEQSIPYPDLKGHIAALKDKVNNIFNKIPLFRRA